MIYLFAALPTAGKTTLARQLESTHDAVRFTLDERMINKYEFTIFDDEYGPLAAQEKDLIWQEAQVLLNQGQSVSLDWSLWSQKARQEWISKIEGAGYTYKLFYLDVPLSTIKDRLTIRNTQTDELPVFAIPYEEIVRFSKIFQPPTADENLNLIHMRPTAENPWLATRSRTGAEYDAPYEDRAANGEDIYGEANLVQQLLQT